MKKSIKFIASVFAATMFSLAACDNTNKNPSSNNSSSESGKTETPIVEPEKKNFIVTFDTNGGSTISSSTVKENDIVAKPADPAKEGFIFDGWYIDSTLTNKMDFSKPITSDTTLYSKWKVDDVKVIYIVSFDTNGGPSIESQRVEEGSKATKPIDPEREGYSFFGWFTNVGLTEPMNFDNPINSNLDLHAKWEQVIIDNTVYGIVDRDLKIPADVEFSTESHVSTKQTTIDCGSLSSSGSYNQNFDKLENASVVDGIKLLKYRYNTNGGFHLFADNSYYSNTLYHGREGTIFNVDPLGCINKVTVSYSASYSSTQNKGYAFTGDEIIKPNIRFGNDPSCVDYVYFLDPALNNASCDVNLSGYEYFSVCTGTYNLTLNTIVIDYDNNSTSGASYNTSSGNGKTRINPTKYTYSLVPGESKITVPLKTEYNKVTNAYTVVESKELTYYTTSYVSSHPECKADAAITDPILVCAYYTAFRKWPANYAKNTGGVKSIFGDKARQVSEYNRTDGYVRAVPWNFNGVYFEFDIDLDGSYQSSRGSGRVVAWESGWSGEGYDDSPVCIYTDDHYNTFLEYLNNGTWSNRFNAEGLVAGIKHSIAPTVTLTGFDPNMVEGTSGGGDIGGDEDEQKVINDDDYYANSAPTEMINEYTATYQQVTNKSGIRAGCAYTFGNNAFRILYPNGPLYTVDESNHTVVFNNSNDINNVEKYYFELVSESTCYVFRIDGRGNKFYLGCNTNNPSKVIDSRTLFNFGFDAYGNFKISCNGKYFRFNTSGNLYRFYDYGSQNPIQLYRLCDVEGAIPPVENYIDTNDTQVTSTSKFNSPNPFYIVSEGYKKCMFGSGKVRIDPTTKALQVEEHARLESVSFEKHNQYDLYAIKHNDTYIKFVNYYDGYIDTEVYYYPTYFDFQFDSETGKVKIVPMNLNGSTPEPESTDGKQYYLTYLPNNLRFGFVDDESKVDTYIYTHELEPNYFFHMCNSTFQFEFMSTFILVDETYGKCLTDNSDANYVVDSFNELTILGEYNFVVMNIAKDLDFDAYYFELQTDEGIKYIRFNAETSEVFLGDYPDYFLITFEGNVPRIEAATYTNTGTFVSISSTTDNYLLGYNPESGKFMLCKEDSELEQYLFFVEVYYE